MMEDFFQSGHDFFNHLVDSFWASLPEQTADDLAHVKKTVLTSVRDGITSLIDEELECTDRHLENARRMREQYRQASAPESEPATGSAT